jgi:ribonuclease BN (tRNA processing enzyme)
MVLPLLLQTVVVVLGTGTPNPDPERSGPAVAVVVDGTAYLVDAGPGVMRRAAAAAARYGLPGLRAPNLRHVFLTHLHSDHTVGLPDVIHTGWVLERDTPLQLFGPPGTVRMAHHLTEAWAADIANRTTGAQPHTPDGWRVEARDIERDGVVYRDERVTVRAFAVPHADWEHALGYRFETRDRVVVISGDTRPSDAVVEACNGCDLLLHEVYSDEAFQRREPEWQRYHAGAHTSTVELAAIARRARPGLLVLYHQLYWGATDEDLVRELRRAGYEGPVVSARDLDRFPEG